MLGNQETYLKPKQENFSYGSLLAYREQNAALYPK
jgi:hypothetical protein